MNHVHKTVLIWHSAQQMFDLVTDVARYPEFLPWCDQARILESRHAADDVGQSAEIGIAFSGLQQRFSTRNTHIRHASGALEDRMHLLKGPFSVLEGHWLLTPVGDASLSSCRIELHLDYDFSSQALSVLVGPVFNKITSSLVDAFVKRADQIYG